MIPDLIDFKIRLSNKGEVMKKMVSAFAVLFFFVITAFLPQGEKKVFAASTGQVSCGDYELLTRKVVKEDKASKAVSVEEELYRINNKTGETWKYKGFDTGWEKVREQR